MDPTERARHKIAVESCSRARILFERPQHNMMVGGPLHGALCIAEGWATRDR